MFKGKLSNLFALQMQGFHFNSYQTLHQRELRVRHYKKQQEYLYQSISNIYIINIIEVSLDFLVLRLTALLFRFTLAVLISIVFSPRRLVFVNTE